MAHRAVSVARSAYPDLAVLAYASFGGAAQELREAGATEVVSADHAATKLLVWDALSRAGIDDDRAHTVLNRVLDKAIVKAKRPVTLSAEQKDTPRCNHTDSVTIQAAPEPAVCPECVAQGDSWVHLRICMTCGHMGCCDSSKNKHATKHFESSQHPIIKSLEPGEDWAWCYVDKVTF